MCECEGKEPTEFVKVKFIGGEHKRGRARGPYKSYRTGRVYVMPKRYTDKKAYPFWEYVDEACEDEIPAFWKKRMEEGMKRAEDLFQSSTEAVALDVGGQDEESHSPGLTKVYGIATPDGIRPVTEDDTAKIMSEQRLLTMEDNMLKTFIESNGGKVDGRWGREKLLEEARTLL